jgi:DNA-binding transcriptional regulator YhcF (GntR family)
VYVKRGIGTFIAAAPREVKGRHEAVARQLAERMLREAYRQGVLASDLIAALEEIAPGRGTPARSAPGGKDTRRSR